MNKEELLSILPLIYEVVEHDTDVKKMSEAAKERLFKIMDYNVIGGKMHRGLSVVESVSILKGGILDEHTKTLASILGWCVEILQASFLVADDIMDQSLTRRGKLCWYKQPNVGLIAVNDALILESVIYKVIKYHFKTKSYYIELLDIFHDVTFKTELGQMIDLLNSGESGPDITQFSMETYKLIVLYKTAYYSFQLPVFLALIMNGCPAGAFDIASPILLSMGEYFQIQDDYLDCFGDPNVMGKVGTDIQDGKCSWLIMTALNVADEKTINELKEIYGKKNKTFEERVKSIYISLGLPSIFEKFEFESYNKIKAMISLLDESLLSREILQSFVRKIYKRNK